MSSDIRQRGYNSADGGSGNALPPSTTVTTAAPRPSDQRTPEERKLDEALGKVLAAQTRLDDLHASWLGYLRKISLIVVLLAAHQCKDPMEVCLADVKDHNSAVEAGGVGEEIGAAAAAGQVLRNGLCEYISIALAGLVGNYLTTKGAAFCDFTSWPYVVSVIVVFVLVYFFAQTYDQVGCAGRGLGGEGLAVIADNNADNRTRQFPVAVVFYVIVTIALSFIKFIKSKMAGNAKMVADLRHRAKEAKKK